MTIKISPLDPLSDSQLSDAQYEKAMSLKAEKEAKASQKLAEQQASRAEKEASEAEKAASKAEQAASKAEAKLASVKEAEKAQAQAEAQAEALNTTLKQQAWERVDQADYVKNRTNASAYWGIEDQALLAIKIEDLRQDEYWQVYIQLRNASNYQALVTEAHELAKASRSALRNTSVSELAKAAEEAKTKAEALAQVAEEAKAKVAELKSRSKDDDEDMSEESIRRPHRVTVICRCHACCCCVVCAGPCARPARSLGGRPQCGNQYFRVCQVLERGAATPRVLERLGRLP